MLRQFILFSPLLVENAELLETPLNFLSENMEKLVAAAVWESRLHAWICAGDQM